MIYIIIILDAIKSYIYVVFRAEYKEIIRP